MARPKSNTSAQSSATIGCEAKLWLTADKLRNNMDAAEYKHVVLGLIFLKYISDTFEEHRADYVLANPPFNDSDWFRKDDDVRFFSLSASNGERAGVRCRNDLPPKGNANFAWVQHFIHHLAPQGMAGLNAVRKDLANGSMSSNQSGEGDIRRALIEADWEISSDEMRTKNGVFPTSTFETHPSKFASLPGQLFYRHENESALAA